MNLSTLLLECYRRLNFTATPTTSVTTRLTGYLNDAHRRIVTSPGFEQLRDDTTTFASVASQVRYGLPPTVARVERIIDISNQRRLRAMRRDDYRRLDPGLTASGVSEYYIPVGEQAVMLQPAAATGLWAVSSSASDTTPKIIIEAITTGGYVHVPVAAGTTLTGTTRVALGTRTDMILVQQCYLTVACVGYVSLYSAATLGTELARIEPGKTASKFHAIELWPAPAAAVTYTVDYTRTVSDLVDPTDEPFLPEDFHYILVLMACRREFTSADDKTRYSMMVAEEAEALKSLRSWLLYPPDYRVRNTDPSGEYADGSNLGGYFPAGRW